MKFKVIIAATALCFVVSSQSFGFDLLNRMLKGSGCGADAKCCATPEPTCGCDRIGKIRDFFNRGRCDDGCEATPGCDAKADGCDGNGKKRCRMLSFDMKCVSIPVMVPKICLPKIKLPNWCVKSCCDNGCDAGDNKEEATCEAKKADPSCGCDRKARCGGLLDRLKNRPKKGCGCEPAKKDCGAEPACGTEAPKPAAATTSTGAVPPAPVVDPAAFGGVQATPISDVK
jgi:hypothetical protein